jgi:hypothetical protein
LKYKHIIHETPDAVLIQFEDDAEGVWFPKARVEIDEDDNVVTMREGLAVEKGVEGYME